MKTTKTFREMLLNGLTEFDIKINFLVMDITAESVQVHITGVDSETNDPILDIANLIIQKGGEITLDMSIPLQIVLS